MTVGCNPELRLGPLFFLVFHEEFLNDNLKSVSKLTADWAMEFSTSKCQSFRFAYCVRCCLGVTYTPIRLQTLIDKSSVFRRMMLDKERKWSWNLLLLRLVDLEQLSLLAGWGAWAYCENAPSKMERVHRWGLLMTASCADLWGFITSINVLRTPKTDTFLRYLLPEVTACQWNIFLVNLTEFIFTPKIFPFYPLSLGLRSIRDNGRSSVHVDRGKFLQ